MFTVSSTTPNWPKKKINQYSFKIVSTKIFHTENKKKYIIWKLRIMRNVSCWQLGVDAIKCNNADSSFSRPVWKCVHVKKKMICIIGCKENSCQTKKKKTTQIWTLWFVLTDRYSRIALQIEQIVLMAARYSPPIIV